MSKRVVVTGIGALSPLGHDWPTVRERLLARRSSIQVMPGWEVYEGLNTRLGSLVQHFDLPEHYNRKTMRSMGRVALFGTRASELALADAGLLGEGRARITFLEVAEGAADPGGVPGEHGLVQLLEQSGRVRRPGVHLQ
mgnify:CR=1 FL=1